MSPETSPPNRSPRPHRRPSIIPAGRVSRSASRALPLVLALCSPVVTPAKALNPMPPVLKAAEAGAANGSETETAAAVAESSTAGPHWRQTSGPADIAPPGWRRGPTGWQRIDGRPLPDLHPGKTINELIRKQQNSETAGRSMRFLAAIMSHLRMLDPITVASAEISAFCLLAYRVLRRE